MKLRNKKTGEIRKAEAREDGIYLYDEMANQWWKYELDILAGYWEYYIEPIEPLIKDEKIRKAVGAWAEVNAIRQVSYVTDSRICRLTDVSDYDSGIDFVGWIPTLNDMKRYTIAELCGEE